jgi:hypothetical protein
VWASDGFGVDPLEARGATRGCLEAAHAPLQSLHCYTDVGVWVLGGCSVAAAVSQQEWLDREESKWIPQVR